MNVAAVRRWIVRPLGPGLASLAGLLSAAAAPAQDAPLPAPRPVAEAAATDPAAPRPVSMAEAMDWALRNNPELAALRRQHGVAAAGVVIARTYPFNPLLETRVRPDWGPPSAGITNAVAVENTLLLELELRKQGQHRRAAALAALSRADWEIANQEVLLAVRVARAFDTVLYRQEKLRLIAETVRLNEKAAVQVRELLGTKNVRPADLILLSSEVADARSQGLPGGSALVTAWADLRRALGVVGEGFTVEGALPESVAPAAPEELLRVALERRPDLRARVAAVGEAEARLRLEVANRYGNPTVGPTQEYDPSRINLVGVQFAVPLPAFNTHEGEIMQRRAERERAALEVRQYEVQVRQDVLAALARLDGARAWAEAYRTRVLPDLEKGLGAMEKLLVAGEVDVLRVLDLRRKVLAARNAYLDALFEISQARADLAAAAGDPCLAVAP